MLRTKNIWILRSKTLVDWAKPFKTSKYVELGGKRTVEFTPGSEELSFTNREMKHTVEPRTINIKVSKSSEDIQLT